MSQQLIIGGSIVLALAVAFAVKGWLHHVLSFKMDESAILNVLKASGADESHRTTEALSARTDIEAERVSQVCLKSNAIQGHADQQGVWCLKRI